MEILQCVTQINDDIIRWRRNIYENPELSDEEFQTLALIRTALTEMGIDFVDVPGGGIIGYIEGNTPGKTVLLRADMDALPIVEDTCNDKQPKACLSKVPGVAHLCGHDAHVAMLLGAGKVLNEHRDEIEGRVILFFEQGEECGHGDIHMMAYIQKNNVQIDSCWALHTFPELPCGVIGLIPGGVFAGALGWEFDIAPKDSANTNPVDCAVSILSGLQAARLSAVAPFEALTFTPCMFKTNPDGSCTIAGACRFYESDKAGLPMKRAIRRIVENTCQAYECTTTRFELTGPKEGLLNDPTCYQIAKDAVTDALGANYVSGLVPTMGGESFSALSSYYPSVMALLGMRDEEKGFTATLHSPRYEANEEALRFGVSASVAYALAFLRYKEPIPFDAFQGDFDAFLAARERD